MTPRRALNSAILLTILITIGWIAFATWEVRRSFDRQVGHGRFGETVIDTSTVGARFRLRETLNDRQLARAAEIGTIMVPILGGLILIRLFATPRTGGSRARRHHRQLW